ncbi:MAG: PqqD family protein [Spirochaetaceae bacterium]|jgi:hypothetical protein|nr:PqqD family protein [Spirochaetaceae bacterium]
MIAFSHLADYIPVRKDLKLRIEGAIGIVSNASDYRIDYLNESALAVFQLIDGKRNVAEIARCFREETAAAEAVFEHDLVELLRNFQWQKLIVLKKKV